LATTITAVAALASVVTIPSLSGLVALLVGLIALLFLFLAWRRHGIRRWLWLAAATVIAIVFCVVLVIQIDEAGQAASQETGTRASSS